ncbi:MAG: aldo/keto reductase [Actinobacteria bacterium]|nr:aldo/keto reductase [Actinomycetota bacterium]
MRYRPLGRTGLEVSEVSIGSWLTYGGGIASDAAHACTRAAFEVGINYFDTANVYGFGASERALGEVLADYPRDSYLLATKVGMPAVADFSERGSSAAQIARQIDASLERLRTDYVDVYFSHRFDPTVPIEETVEAFQAVLAAGKARHIGFSEWTAEQIEAGIQVGGPDLFAVSTPQYSMIWRAPEAELFALTAPHGINHVVWWPLAQGVLSGKYKVGSPPPPDSRAASSSMGNEMELVMLDASLEAVERLRPIAAEAGLDLPTLALAWTLRRPEVASTLVGVSRPGQVHANAAAAGVALSPDLLAAVDEAIGDAKVTGPARSEFVEPGVLWRDGTTSAAPAA